MGATFKHIDLSGQRGHILISTGLTRQHIIEMW
jgi:hypothetical protein